MAADEHRFIFGNQIGRGVYGCVFEAKRVHDKYWKLAIKEIHMPDKERAEEESIILRRLPHVNILNVIDSWSIAPTSGDDDGGMDSSIEMYINEIVSPLYSGSLLDILYRGGIRRCFIHGDGRCVKWFKQMKDGVKVKAMSGVAQSPIIVKCIGFQLLRALGYMHARRFIHCDIKPSNVLVDVASCDDIDKPFHVVLSDFSNTVHQRHDGTASSSTSYVCSRYYRAPELIFGNTAYRSAIDIWSVACLLVELATGKPLFKGKNNTDQLVRIIKVLGTPSFDEVGALNPTVDPKSLKFPVVARASIVSVISSMLPPNTWPQIEIDHFAHLIDSMLVYDPLRRTGAYQAMMSPFFNEVVDMVKAFSIQEGLPSPLSPASPASLSEIGQMTPKSDIFNRSMPQLFTNRQVPASPRTPSTPALAPGSWLGTWPDEGMIY